MSNKIDLRELLRSLAPANSNVPTTTTAKPKDPKPRPPKPPLPPMNKAMRPRRR